MSILDDFDEIRQLFAESDAEKIADMLEEWGYHSDGSCDCHCPSHKEELCLFLGLAAALAGEMNYSEEAAWAIINRVSSVIDPFKMLSFIIQHKAIKKPKSYNLIPSNIRKALQEEVYTKEIGEQIAGLTDDETKALLFYIMDKIESVKAGVVAPLLKASYRLIDNTMFYAFLSFSVEPPHLNAAGVSIIIAGNGKILPFGGVNMVIRDGSKKDEKKPEEEATSVPKEDEGMKA